MAEDSIGQRWRTVFWEAIQGRENADPLKEASLTGRLGEWTAQLTDVVVSACEAVGWQASAKGHRLELLPEARCEYLGLDVMAFADSTNRWRFPVAAIELENSRRDDRVAYSLWKTLCVRADLRVVFCYRQNPDVGPPLVRLLPQEVLGALPLATRVGLTGETLLVVGSRGDAQTFPYGFFRWWRLETNTGAFAFLR